jgi:DNA-binding MarR family transcriptional regulator
MPKHIGDLLHSGELAPRHVGVFVVIALNGPMSVSELARREGFALSTASLLVTQLAEAGLVERREDPQDRRRTLVTVAPEHRRESEEVIESKLAPLRRGLARMGRERAAVLVEALGVLAEEISRDVGDDCAGGDGRGVASSGSARAMSARAASTRAMSARAASARAVSRVGRPQPTGGSKITFPPSRAANERQEQRP